MLGSDDISGMVLSGTEHPQRPAEGQFSGSQDQIKSEQKETPLQQSRARRLSHFCTLLPWPFYIWLPLSGPHTLTTGRLQYSGNNALPPASPVQRGLGRHNSASFLPPAEEFQKLQAGHIKVHGTVQRASALLCSVAALGLIIFSPL